jgi:hypothetical protein
MNVQKIVKRMADQIYALHAVRMLHERRDDAAARGELREARAASARAEELWHRYQLDKVTVQRSVAATSAR